MPDLIKPGGAGPRPGQEHYLADIDRTPLQATDALTAASSTLRLIAAEPP